MDRRKTLIATVITAPFSELNNLFRSLWMWKSLPLLAPKQTMTTKNFQMSNPYNLWSVSVIQYKIQLTIWWMTILQKYPTKTETFVRSVTKDCLENKCLVRDLRHHHTLSKTTKTIRASTKMKSRLKDKGLRLKVSKRWLLKVRHRPQTNQDKVASTSKGIRKLYANSTIVIPQMAK